MATQCHVDSLILLVFEADEQEKNSDKSILGQHLIQTL